MIFGVPVRVCLGLAFLTGPPLAHAADLGHQLKKRPRTSLSIVPNGAVVHTHDPTPLEGSLVAEFDAFGDVDVVGGQHQEAPPQRDPHIIRAVFKGPAGALDAVGDHATAPKIHSKRGVVGIAPSKSDAAGPNEDHELPPWAQILITSTLMLVVMSIWWTVRAMMNTPIPREADSERLAAVLQEALEQVQSLEEQLETRQEVDAMFVDSDDSDETGDPAARDAERRTREIHESAAKMAEKSKRLNEGALRAQGEFTRGVDKAREAIQDCAEKETADLFATAKDAVNQNEATLDKWEPPDWMTEEGHLKLPPFMQLISGATANSQIRAIRFFNSGCVSVGSFMLVLSVVTFVVDWKKKCVDSAIWVWHIGLLSITTFDTLCRILIVRNASKSLHFLKWSRIALDKEDTNKGSGGGVFDMFGSFSRRSKKFFDASFKYYALTDSWSYSLGSLLSTVSLLWGAVGLYISIHNIIQDSMGCKATIAVFYMHVYSIVYVMLLTWNALGIALWILDFVSGSALVRTPLVKFAKYCDDDMMYGMPIVLSLVQSFVLKESSDEYSLKTRQVLKEIHEIEETQKQLRERLSDQKINRVRLHEMKRQAKSEEEFMTRCQQRVMTGLDELKPIVGLLAANVTTTEGPDPTAGGSSSAPRRSTFVHFEDDEDVDHF